MYKQTLASVYFWVVIVLLWLYVIGYCEVKLGVWRFVLIWKKTIFDRLFDVLSLGVWFIILYCECVFTLDLSKRNHFIALYFISILWFSTTCPSSFPCLVTLLSPLNPHAWPSILAEDSVSCTIFLAHVVFYSVSIRSLNRLMHFLTWPPPHFYYY